MKRRDVIVGGLAAGAVTWTAPEILSSTRATASASVIPPKTATSSLWKWNVNPPTEATVCATGPVGSATRGSVTFTVNCGASPKTISVTITVTSGPELSGANARTVRLLQSTAAGACSSGTDIGTYNSPNNTPVTLGPVALTAGTSYYSLMMIETAGGGTDTYTTNRVNIVC